MATTATPTKRLVSLKEGAEFYGVTIRTMSRYIDAGLFPAYRLPGQRTIRVDLADLDGALATVPAKVVDER